jgi:hypothetical protein
MGSTTYRCKRVSAILAGSFEKLGARDHNFRVNPKPKSAEPIEQVYHRHSTLNQGVTVLKNLDDHHILTGQRHPFIELR